MIENVSLGTRDLSVAETHWRDILNFEFPKEGGVVLIMPGGTVDRPKSANGCIKRFCDSMGELLPKDTKVLCAYYDDHGVPTHRIKSLKAAGVLLDVKSSLPKEELPPSPDFKQFFNLFFLPLLIDENKKQRSVKEICDKLNRLILVAYCYGGFVSYEMAKLLSLQLKKMKFPSKDRLKILKAFKVVACASRFPMQASKADILHVVSYSDKQQERNWKHTNFHAFVNTKKRREDNPALVLLNENERVLCAEKLLTVEMDDHHYRGYFCDYTIDFEKTDEGKFVTNFICEYVANQLLFGKKKSFKQLLKVFSNKKEISTRLVEGEKLLLEYKKRNLKFKKDFLRQESLVLQGDVAGMEELLKNGQQVLPFKNKQGDFLIHLAIQNNNTKMVDLITKNEVFWFQSFNAKKENPILIALKMRNLEIATLLWDRLMSTRLPTFESYQVLNSIKRRTFKSILLFIRKVPEAVDLMNNILKNNNFLPFKQEDMKLILRQYEMAKKQKTADSKKIMKTLKQCIARCVDENGTEMLNPITKQCKRLFPKTFIDSLMREG
ncbi:MAG: hypothetical protein IJY92_02390 [Alphaproteobacteria bacterium]|nr:hypothetical protein [Alphaproteobacteria bacterium]